MLVNGGLNLSELDGWWAEAYTPEVGWAIGDGREHGDDPGWDAAEAEALYALLEREVIPEFYRLDERGIPSAWVSRMRESMTRLTPIYSANRAVRQYTEQHYLLAAAAFRDRAAGEGSLGAHLLSWNAELAKLWPKLRFGSSTVEQKGQERFYFRFRYFLTILILRQRGAKSRPLRGRIGTETRRRSGVEPTMRTMRIRIGDRLAGSVKGFRLYRACPGDSSCG